LSSFRRCVARFAGLVFPNWIEIAAAPKTMDSVILNAKLDGGETAAIALCMAENADALLIDETLGRRLARLLGIRAIGILGILIEAKNSNLIPSVKTLLERLESEAGFWISAGWRIKTLAAVNER
jgi:uncharacterized protein